MRILLLEDDVEMAQYVVRGFREAGAVIDHALRGGDALMMATGGSYDVLILDRMVPAPDGLKVLAMIRAGGDTTPALFLTAVDSVEDRVEGLELADDYLVKPFAFSELRARVAAILRRPRGESQTLSRLVAGDLEIDLLKRTVQRGGAVAEPSAHGIPAARVPGPAQGRSRDADDASGTCMGFQLRPSYQHRRDAHQPP
jgi:two-component system OmpR family response regulator